MKSLGMVSEKDRELLAKKIKDAVYKRQIEIFEIRQPLLEEWLRFLLIFCISNGTMWLVRLALMLSRGNRIVFSLLV